MKKGKIKSFLTGLALISLLLGFGSSYFVFSSSMIQTAHNITHQNGGIDEISVTGLSGLLADDQHIAYTGVTKANLPAPGTTGRIARVTDNILGLWMATGAQWFGLNGEIVNVREFGAKGDDSTNDTGYISNAINAANAITGLNKPTLYFPAGTYRVDSNTLPDIKCNVYGPDATIRGTVGSTNTLALLSVDYTTTIGQTFILRSIHGADYGGATPYNCGLQIKGADNSVFRINQLELLDTGISLAGNILPGHIAQNTFYIQTCMSVNIGFNLTSGTGIQVEANTFYIEYLNPRTVNGYGVYLSNANNYTTNNIFKINVLELGNGGNGQIGFKLTGTTPANVFSNVFEVSSGLQLPTGTGKFFICDTNIGKNIFRLCGMSNYHLTQGYMTFSSSQIIQGSDTFEWARSIFWGSEAPTVGYHLIGSICWNMGSATPNGWRCTVAGVPGTWTAF